MTELEMKDRPSFMLTWSAAFLQRQRNQRYSAWCAWGQELDTWCLQALLIITLETVVSYPGGLSCLLCKMWSMVSRAPPPLTFQGDARIFSAGMSRQCIQAFPHCSKLRWLGKACFHTVVRWILLKWSKLVRLNWSSYKLNALLSLSGFSAIWFWWGWLCYYPANSQTCSNRWTNLPSNLPPPIYETHWNVSLHFACILQDGDRGSYWNQWNHRLMLGNQSWRLTIWTNDCKQKSDEPD